MYQLLSATPSPYARDADKRSAPWFARQQRKLDGALKVRQSATGSPEAASRHQPARWHCTPVNLRPRCTHLPIPSFNPPERPTS